MDVSPKYILMCEKAKELQDNWNPTRGDWFYIKEGEFSQGEPAEYGDIHFEGEIVTANELDFPDKNNQANYIWLPRQDQLQEMVGGKTIIHTLVKFYDFIFEYASELCGRCFNDEAARQWGEGKDFYEQCIAVLTQRYASMEQLWLAFLFSEKYGKVWSDDKQDWIKEDKDELET